MQPTNAIFKTLFNRNYNDGDNVNFLEELTQAHPYFSPAQFYLLQKTEAESPVFNKQAAKTSIFFNNPLWLSYQLKQVDENDSANRPVIEAAELHASDETEINESAAIVTETETSLAGIASPQTNEMAHEPGQGEYDANDTDAAETFDQALEPMKIELKMPAENSAKNEALLFEPMHLVDYFASQGIKLTEENLTADKLGKQLKSFTEWLKTMKKVHTENQPTETEDAGNTIQTLAENSNAKAEVLTEAMAEVFTKQGKLKEARKLYEKLSLLNPAKSAYFAAKIENLKEI